MSPEDWTQIKHAFTAALNLPSGERDAFVAAACDDRPEIIEAVAELLRAHTEASQTFLHPESLIVAARWLFQEGDRVADRFRVVRRIARGAMGEVYQVFDERLRLHIALKAIRPELVEDAETVERFRREVLVTRDIAHEGLCRVFDLVEHKIEAHPALPAGTIVPCLTMQLLDGETLEDWLATRRPLSAKEALPLIEQIASALQVLHEADVVHRDLKPSNVMLVRDGDGVRAVLTDFGLAKPLGEVMFETQTRVQGGAPFFMAPELFRQEGPSVASDLYAFGLLIDEMITATRAFNADSLHSLLLQKLKGSPPPPSKRGSTAPRQWEQIIQCCLARDPRDRFAAVQDVLSALRTGTRWSRWRCSAKWMKSTYLPRRWRAVQYATSFLAVIATFVAVVAASTPVAPTSVAISPFKNLTGDAGLDYLCEGSSSELGRRLRQIAHVQVYSPIESGPPPASVQAATYALRGHVQRTGALLRVSVELSHVATGRLAWSANFDGRHDDALNLEDELAAAAVIELTRPIRPDGSLLVLFDKLAQLWSSPQVPSSLTKNAAAYDDYLRGLDLTKDRTRESVLEARRLLRRAVQRDPEFAAAYAALADVQTALIDLHYAPADELIPEAERHLAQAIALDPELPEAQLSLAAVRQVKWDWAGAEKAYVKAIQLSSSARARRWYAGLLLQFGQFDKAFPLYEEAIALDPYDFGNETAHGHGLLNAGKLREAETLLEQTLTRRDFLNAHILVGQVYAELARIDASRRQEYIDKALKESDVVRSRETAVRVTQNGKPIAWPFADLIGAMTWSLQGNREQAQPYLDRLLQGHEAKGISPGFLARVHAAQGRAPEAIAYLLEAETTNDRELYYINVSSVYSGIRNEPQFRALVERLHLSR
jgi:serine/threonine protein kinase/tetratricopeptide (TPR) repeat protein